MNLKINQPNYTIDDRYHLDVHCVEGDLELPSVRGIHFVLSIDSELSSPGLQVKGCYGAMVNEGRIKGRALVVTMMGISRSNLRATLVDPGHPANLSYIDGCSNSNIVDPDRNGDPCLNYLYFPPGVNQTFHVHPSVRIGIIVSGHGYADSVDEKGNTIVETLAKGDIFVLDRFSRHRFRTCDSIMSILVFHPDSEDGARDEYNPMKTRTYLR